MTERERAEALQRAEERLAIQERKQDHVLAINRGEGESCRGCAVDTILAAEAEARAAAFEKAIQTVQKCCEGCIHDYPLEAHFKAHSEPATNSLIACPAAYLRALADREKMP